MFEMSFSRQSTALVLTTENKETKHYIHSEHKRQTEKPAPANKQTKPWFGTSFMTFGHKTEWALFLQP